MTGTSGLSVYKAKSLLYRGTQIKRKTDRNDYHVRWYTHSMFTEHWGRDI